MNKYLLVVLALSSALSKTKAQNYLDESEKDFNKRTEWFVDAKFGMFIHFGLYSQLGGEWKGKIYNKTGPNDKYHYYSEWIAATADIAPQEYASLLSTFNPIKFNADLIAKTAKAAGMKYIVITTKHHEGFCLWDSKYTKYDIASTPCNRDILRELKEACDKYNLKFGTYYSIIDWNHPSQARNPYGDRPGVKWSNLIIKPNQLNNYRRYMKNQIKELIENYDTEILWFDGDWVSWWNNIVGEDLYNYIRSLKPSIIINNRVAKREHFKKDFGTPEQEHPEDGFKYLWEACYTLNDSWGYKKDDFNWKTPETVLKKLNQINSKGGNLLLNIGPKGNGEVPKESIDILLEVGRLSK